MSRIFVLTLLLAACVGCVTGCKDDAASTGTGSGTGTGTGAASGTGTTGPASGTGAGSGSVRAPATSAAPSREQAVQVLQMVADALEAKDYDKAVTYFQIPPGKTPEQFKATAPGLVEQQVISKEGVEVLGAEGNWGSLQEVFAEESANRLAERAGVPVDQCYGLSHAEGEAGFHWTGQEFKVIHCNNIGKLKK
jgi:hypothetical protein